MYYIFIIKTHFEKALCIYYIILYYTKTICVIVVFINLNTGVNYRT